MHPQQRTQREACAATARPDVRDTSIKEIADALARLGWLHDYERAERRYWTGRGE